MAALEQGFAGLEIESSLANIFAHSWLCIDDDGVSRTGCGIFLNDDRIRTVGNDTAREDAHRLAGTNCSVEWVAGRRGSYDSELGAYARIAGTHRIAVHYGHRRR